MVNLKTEYNPEDYTVGVLVGSSIIQEV